jgi:hypothetical protein
MEPVIILLGLMAGKGEADAAAIDKSGLFSSFCRSLFKQKLIEACRDLNG